MARLFSAFDAARLLLAAVFLIGIGALGIALLGEHVFGIQPCILCLYQRVPYFISAVLAGAAAALPVSFGARRLALALCGVVFTAGAALAFYSVGVEDTGGSACLAVTAIRRRISLWMIYASFQRQHRLYEAAMSTCGGCSVFRLQHTTPFFRRWRPAAAFSRYAGFQDGMRALSLRPLPFLRKGHEQKLSFAEFTYRDGTRR